MTEEPVIRTDLTPEQLATLEEEAAVWAAFTPVQADAVRATAAQHLRDPLELALEMWPLLRDRPSDLQATEIPRTTQEVPVLRILPSPVNRSLTPTDLGVPTA